jgi:hypothetical protein
MSRNFVGVAPYFRANAYVGIALLLKGLTLC